MSIAALVVSLVATVISGWALVHSVRTEQRRAHLESEHRELEQQLMRAQLEDRKSSQETIAREIFVRSLNLRLRLNEFRERKLTPDALRGIALWSDPDVDQIVRLASQFDNTASRFAATAADALSVVRSMIDPYHASRDPRIPVRSGFDAQKLGACVTDAHGALLQLAAHVEPTAGDFALPDEEER